MSETFSDTRDAVRRLKAVLLAADDDTRHKFAYWVIGLAMMAAAIIVQFGWLGAAFCIGMVFWAASSAPGERT